MEPHEQRAPGERAADGSQAGPGSVSTRGRRAVLAAAVTALLLVVPAATAAFSPRLTASSTGGVVTLSYSLPAWHESAATLALYAPTAYVPKLNHTAGATLGTAIVRANPAGQSTPMVLRGTITVAAAATPLTGAAASTVGDATKACTRSDAPVALWLATVRATSPRTTLQLPIAVQETDVGELTGVTALTICPPPADVPADTAGRAPRGLKIVRLTLTLPGVFDVPAGMHVWHLRATPYAPGTSSANSALTVEAEGHHGVPQRLSLLVRPALRPNRALVTGRLTLAGEPVAGQTVRILAAGKVLGTAKTNDAGGYRARVTLPSRNAPVKATVKVPARYFPRCIEPAFPSLLIGCSSSILAGYTTTSPRTRVRG